MKTLLWLAFTFLLALPATATAGFIFTDDPEGYYAISGYSGTPPDDLVIPDFGSINGKDDDITGLLDRAFQNAQIFSVTVPDSVTHIDDQVFLDCQSLMSVTILGHPTFGNGVFEGCTSLAGATILGLFGVSDSMFEDCTSLASFSIPSTVTNIGTDAFMGSGLTSLTIPDGVTAIGTGVAANCPKLKSITVSSKNPSFKSVGGVLFDKKQTTLMQYPAGKTGTSYAIPSGVTTIASSAFAGSVGLKSVTIPSTVTEIDSSAFMGCTGLKSVTIPSKVTILDGSVFSGCTALTSITVSAGNPSFRSVNGVLFDMKQATLIEYPAGKAGSYAIPSGVTSVGAEAFESCPQLTSVTIPHGVTGIGTFAFSFCAGLKQVSIPSSVTEIGEGAFANCGALASVKLPAGLTSIKDYTFSNTGLTSVTIPAGVTSIGNSAFTFCPALKSVTIPASVASIETFAFSFCPELTSVTIPANTSSIGLYAFANNTALTKAVFLGNAPTMGSGVFYSAAGSFKVNYYTGATGFTSPTWTDSSSDTYPTATLPAKTLKQAITFPALANQVYGATFSMGAEASSGLPVTYTHTGPIAITGDTAKITGVGPISIRASQSGNAAYSAAPSVLRSFTAGPATQTITFPAVGAATVGGKMTLAATSTSGLAIQYSIIATSGYKGTATISGSKITFTGAGTIKLAADQAGNADYSPAAQKRQNVVISAK